MSDYNLCRRDLLWMDVVVSPLEDYIYRIQNLRLESWMCPYPDSLSCHLLSLGFLV